MAKPSRTWDGKQMTGGVSGFTQYNTERAETPETPAPVLSPDDLLKEIRALRAFTDLPKLATALKTLEQHIADTNNPHHTDITDFPSEVADVLYEEFLRRGGTGSKEYYLAGLFQTLRVALPEELEDPDKENLAVSVRDARLLITEHEVDPDAHAGIFTQMFPGTAITDNPYLAVYGFLGVSGGILEIQEKPASESSSNQSHAYTVCGSDGFVHRFSDVAYFSTDRSQGRELIPAFGLRRNFVSNSANISYQAEISGVSVVQSAVKGPDNESSVYALDTYTDTIPRTHAIYLKNLAIPANTPYTFSVFVKAHDCDLFELTSNDGTNTTGIVTKAVFDLTNGAHVVVNPLGRYSAEISALSNGWYRCSLTFYNTISMACTLGAAFFKKVGDDLSTTNDSFAGNNERCGYFWGWQLEDGTAVSPLIETSSGYRYQTPMTVVIPTDDEFKTDNFTLSIKFKVPKIFNGSKNKYLFTIVDNDGYKTTAAYFRPDKKFVLERYGHTVAGSTVVYYLLNQEVFNYPEQDYAVFTYAISSEQELSFLNQESGINLLAPQLTTAEAKILIGVGPDLEGLDSYIEHILVYTRKVTVDEIAYLNGEDL